jgi:hypothetical protein
MQARSCSFLSGFLSRPFFSQHFFCFFFLLPDVDCTVDERLYRCRIDDPLQETSREQRIEDGRGVG